MRKPPFSLPFLPDGVSAAQMRDAGMDARMQVSVGQRVAEVRIDVPMQTAARLGRK